MMICYIDKEKTSYKLSDDNVINLCMIKKFLMGEQGGGLSCFGVNSKRCLKTRGN